jgi:hypothetical protein
MKSERSRLEHKLDTVFSIFIRQRDGEYDVSQKGYIGQCFTCGRVTKLENGHFIPRTHRQFRWNENNCHGQCKHCNWTLEGNISVYRDKLAAIHGKQFVDMLEAEKHKPFKISSSEIGILIDYYKKKVYVRE